MLRTERLLLRRLRTDDAEVLTARRNDPEVAKYQDWVTPYPLERAQELIAADLAAPDGPRTVGGWMLMIVDPDDTTVFGDVVVHRSSGGRTAEIGYTLDRKAWGQGYANEATEALVAYLFGTVGVTRVEGRSAPRQHGLGDGPRTSWTAVGGPHAPVVLAGRRQLRRLELRHDPPRLGGLDAPAPRATVDRPADRGDGRQPARRAPACAPTSPRRISCRRWSTPSPTRCSRR